jgi:hypothetical protein
MDYTVDRSLERAPEIIGLCFTCRVVYEYVQERVVVVVISKLALPTTRTTVGQKEYALFFFEKNFKSTMANVRFSFDLIISIDCFALFPLLFFLKGKVDCID